MAYFPENIEEKATAIMNRKLKGTTLIVRSDYINIAIVMILATFHFI